MNEKLLSQVKEFSAKNFPNGSLAKVAKFHTNPHNFWPVYPIHTNSLFWVTFELLKSYDFAIFLLQILLFVEKALKFS